MRVFKHHQLFLAGTNLILIALALRGFFDGMDLLPVVLAAIISILGLSLLAFKRTIAPRYRLIGFALVVLSSLGLYHAHFNLYNREKKAISQSQSLQVLGGVQAPPLTYAAYLNAEERPEVEAYISRNTYTILNFWATWCGPCMKEMPVLEAYYIKNKDLGVGLIGFTDFNGNPESEVAKIRKVVSRLGVTYPILIDSTKQVRTAYRADLLPATVLIDAKGSVVDYQVGLEGAEKIMHTVSENLRSHESLTANQ